MSDTTVTVSDEGEDGPEGAAVEAVVDSVREQGIAEGTAQVHAADAATEAMNAEFAAGDAQRSAETAAQAAQATADAAFATTLEGSAIRSEIAELREAIRELAAVNMAPAVDIDGDGVPDPVGPSDVDTEDQEPVQRGNWLNRTWGSKRG